MARGVHLSTALRMLETPDPVDLTVLKKDGSIMYLTNCVGLKYDKYKGTRRVKLLTSNQIRCIHEVCIIAINDMEVFM